MVRTFDGRSPRIHKTAFIHDACEVIGQVTIGRGASVWPMAVLRGDVDEVRVGEKTNIQDCAVVHCREGRAAVIGRRVTVGHTAIVHGSRIGDLCLVGMGAIVMEAELGRECLVAAGALVVKGFKAPPRSLVLGSPARVVRGLRPSELKHLRDNCREYLRMSALHRRTSRVLF